MDNLGVFNKKILIIHDRFMFCGGAERLVLDMADGLGADIATGFWSEGETYSQDDVPHKLFVLGNPSQLNGWRYVKFQFIFYFRTRFIRGYDVVIFSGNNCLSAAHNVRRGVKKIFYSHTPVRHAYDLREFYLSRMSAWKRPIYRFLTWGSKLVYGWGVRQMDVVIVNSKNVAQRFKDFLDIDARVVYPPIRVENFQWIDQGDYYLSFGRVDTLKRVVDIVRAFQKMPDKKLIITSSGDDFESVKQLADGYENIHIRGWVSNEELYELVGNCIASLYIPIDEDFGMTQIESMAAGKPCIGVNEGGLAETVTEGVTGTLIPKDYTLDDIVHAVVYMTPERALAMKDDCVLYAHGFSKVRFVHEMRAILESVS